MADDQDQLKLDLFRKLWGSTLEKINSGKQERDYSTIIAEHITVERIYTDEEGMGTVVFKVHLHDRLKNSMGYGHGGALTTLLDLLTWNALLVDKAYWPTDRVPSYRDVANLRKSPSLSRKINVRFVRPVVLDNDYLVTCKVVANTAKGAFVSGRIHDESGKTFVYGIQDLAKITKPPAKL